MGRTSPESERVRGGQPRTVRGMDANECTYGKVFWAPQPGGVGCPRHFEDSRAKRIVPEASNCNPRPKRCFFDLWTILLGTLRRGVRCPADEPGQTPLQAWRLGESVEHRTPFPISVGGDGSKSTRFKMRFEISATDRTTGEDMTFILEAIAFWHGAQHTCYNLHASEHRVHRPGRRPYNR